MATDVALTQAQTDMLLALANSDPNLKLALEAAKNGRTDEANAYILASDFYKNNNQIARTRKQAQIEQSGAYQSGLDAYKLSSRKRLVASGARVDTATFDSLAETAYLNGMTDDQFDQAVLASGKVSVAGGKILGDTTDLKNIANSYGVSTLLNASYWDAKSKQLFAGETTANDIEQEIKTLSASAFPAYADGISKGITIDAQASNIKQTMATYLELDPDSISYEDPVFRQMLQYTDPTTKKPAIMPQWLAEKTVKSHPNWGKTKNAQATVDSLTMKVYSDWFGGAV